MRQITTQQYTDEQGHAYAKDAGCLQKCWWVEDQSEVVCLCPFYELKLSHDAMVEHCTDQQIWR
jgi:hypothetical protein